MSTLFNDHEFQTASFCEHCAACVAVAYKDEVVAVRDTKDPSKRTLQFTKDEWQAFIRGVKRGEFDY